MDDLQRFGPECSWKTPVLPAAEEYCQGLARSHYENFPVATWLLPKHLHQHFYNVYAYCRWADDLADETSDQVRSRELLDWWERQLDRCYASVHEKSSAPIHPVFVALASTVQRFSIPNEPFADLISAFRQDQEIVRYETFEQLKDYCQRSANPVGRIVLYLCERHNDENVMWSDSICTGLQLANFWQDIARDYEIGRVYLPKEDREQFQYSAGDLEKRESTKEFRALMEFEVQRARTLLNNGLPLVAKIPGRLKIDIEMFIRGGLEILDAIERIEYRVWETRPVVSKWKLGMAAVSCLFRSVFRP